MQENRSSIFGYTRSSVQNDHALITPDTHVKSSLAGWEQTEIVVLISPEIGTAKRARFNQYLAYMAPGGSGLPPAEQIERVIYVLEGEIEISLDGKITNLKTGGFSFLPAGSNYKIASEKQSQLNVFEKRYVPMKDVASPKAVFGNEADVQATPFLGDEDAMLKVLLPTDSTFDLAVNLFTFNPGAALPFVEVHVMEHGLLMVQGNGIYRLADQWYPVGTGDVIWMASYCPQWFAAVGKKQARYLYYKDVNRYPLEGSAL